MIISSIIADPSVIFTKGMKALERTREMHEPDTYAQKLREIYQKALTD